MRKSKRNCNPNFNDEVNKLADIAMNNYIKFCNSIDEVTKLVQTKYPNISAEYSPSDGGIIFIDDSNMNEYYDIDDLIEWMERR